MYFREQTSLQRQLLTDPEPIHILDFDFGPYGFGGGSLNRQTMAEPLSIETLERISSRSVGVGLGW